MNFSQINYADQEKGIKIFPLNEKNIENSVKNILSDSQVLLENR